MENNPVSAVVFGCAGVALQDEEASFFAAANPLGFVLFARNVESPAQIRRLTSALRASVGRPDAPVLIDQEGGRVQRLKPPLWRTVPAARVFGALFARDPEAARQAVRLNTQLLAEDLADLGISVDCAPVLDVLTPQTHEAIGDRAFSDDPKIVAALGRVMVETFLAQGILPVLKHMPGHGRATADSHHVLPKVTETLARLDAVDFAPFKALRDAPLGMTAHVAFEAADAGRPATLSPTVLNALIRERIGFNGFLFTDDLSMKALGGDPAWRARTALEAGCDAILHCNGDLAEMRAVQAGVGPLSSQAQERWRRAQSRTAARPAPLDRERAVAELEKLLGRDVGNDERIEDLCLNPF